MSKITSRQNQEIKKLKSLQTVKGRKKNQEFLLEGPQVLKEVSGAYPPDRVYYREDYQGFLPEGVPSREVEKNLFNQLTPSNHSQGVLAVYKIFPMEDQALAPGLNLYLEDIQDPGNLGGLIRSGAAFGVKKIFLSRACVDLYNPKVIRSTMSAFFKVSYAYKDVEDLLENGEIHLLRGDLEGRDLQDFSWPEKSLLILGNEAHGVSEKLKEASLPIHIPMEKTMESLNVNVAGSICMYDYYLKNQRRKV